MKKFLHTIFSIVNDGNLKIICILGLKIKIKNNKAEMKSKIKHIEKELDLSEKRLFNILQILNNNIKENISLQNYKNLFSNYAVISDNVSSNIKYLFDKPEYLQTYDNIKHLPKYAIIWGNTPWKPQTDTILYAMQQGIPLLKMEDGFLRSADTWCNSLVDTKYTYGISFTITDDLYYFDATKQNSLERLLNDKSLIINFEQKQRAKACINKIISTNLTKYNHQKIFEPSIGRKDVKKILVVDQSFGDFSISKGLASENTFKEMLECAIKENPFADIIIKTHPDAMAKGSRQKSGYYSTIKPHNNIYTITEPINPISLIKYVDKVYVCTTQLGFEAVMCGKEVNVFGMPFYAGWGLTNDRQTCERRTNTRSIEEVFYIAYILYTYYVNPDTGKQCEIEEAMEYLLQLREEYKEYKLKRSI